MSRKNYFVVSLFIGGLAVIYAVGCLLFSSLFVPDAGTPTFSYILCFVFGLLHMLVSIVCLNLVAPKMSRAMTEATALPLIATVVYLFVAVGKNIIFMMVPNEKLSGVIIVLNLIVMLVYIFYFYGTLRHMDSLAARVENVSQRVINTTEISRLLGNILTLTTDENVRKQLHSLKEQVDYSSNMTGNQSRGFEEAMKKALLELQEIVATREPEAAIHKIEEVDRIWKGRNASKA